MEGANMTNPNVEGMENVVVEGEIPMAAVEEAYDCCEELFPDVTLTGAAKDGRMKPPVDYPVIVTSHPDAYTFSIDLPATSPHLDNGTFRFCGDGNIRVAGTVAGGAAGGGGEDVVPFSISFCLPGPVDPKSGQVCAYPEEGVLECVVMKK